MLPKFLIAALSCWLAYPLPILAWWETGHQTVARIAAAHLTAAARTRIARILDVPDTPESVSDALAHASTWADETKNETQTGAWHYIDLAIQDKKSDIPLRCPNDNCAPARITLFAAQLKSERADTRWSELDALRYLIHFIGDIHQPLHTIDDADLGGNCEQLNPPLETAKNLHALWDGGIIQAMDTDDKALAADLEKQIGSLSRWHEHRISEGTPDDWAWESHELAIRDIYQKLHIPVEPVEFPEKCADAPAAIVAFKPQIDMLYVDGMKPVVREQLEKAGLRLAKMLNDSL